MDAVKLVFYPTYFYTYADDVLALRQSRCLAGVAATALPELKPDTSKFIPVEYREDYGFGSDDGARV